MSSLATWILKTSVKKRLHHAGSGRCWADDYCDVAEEYVVGAGAEA